MNATAIGQGLTKHQPSPPQVEPRADLPPGAGSLLLWGCGLWVGGCLACRRGRRDRWSAGCGRLKWPLAQGLVGGAGLQGVGGDRGRRTTAGAREMRWHAGRLGQTAEAVGGWNVRLRRAVADAVVANQISGGSGRRGRCEPDASAEGRYAGAAGVGGLGASGLPGVGSCPAPAGVAVLVYRTTRRRLGGPRTVGLAPWASVGTATGGSLPCRRV